LHALHRGEEVAGDVAVSADLPRERRVVGHRRHLRPDLADDVLAGGVADGRVLDVLGHLRGALDELRELVAGDAVAGRIRPKLVGDALGEAAHGGVVLLGGGRGVDRDEDIVRAVGREFGPDRLDDVLLDGVAERLPRLLLGGIGGVRDERLEFRVADAAGVLDGVYDALGERLGVGGTLVGDGVDDDRFEVDLRLHAGRSPAHLAAVVAVEERLDDVVCGLLPDARELPWRNPETEWESVSSSILMSVPSSTPWGGVESPRSPWAGPRPPRARP